MPEVVPNHGERTDHSIPGESVEGIDDVDGHCHCSLTHHGS